MVHMVVNRISSVVLRGVSHEGRLIGRDACNREQESNRDTLHRMILRGLLDCIDYRMILREFRGGPCPPYIVRGVGLQVG